MQLYLISQTLNPTLIPTNLDFRVIIPLTFSPLAVKDRQVRKEVNCNFGYNNFLGGFFIAPPPILPFYFRLSKRQAIMAQKNCNQLQLGRIMLSEFVSSIQSECCRNKPVIQN